MNDALSQTVEETFCQVMEMQTFMRPERVEPDTLNLGDRDFLCVSLSFSGAARGRIWIAGPAEFAHEIAANFLGMDADDLFVQENSEDALKEVLNITSGNLLTSLYGVQSLFDLSVPDSHHVPPDAVAELAVAAGSLSFQVEDFPVFLRVALEAEADSGWAAC